MTFNNLLNNERPIAITLTAQDLTNLIKETITNTLGAIELERQEEDGNWLTPRQVMKRLKVTRPTLWRWNKEGYLRAAKFGNRVRYKESDVLKVENAEKGGEQL